MSSNIRDQYIAELGTDVGDAFYNLHLNWLETSVQFEEYRELFNDENDVGMLNAIGAKFFRNIQLIMQDSLILHITRLTDQPGSGKKRNLSVRQIMQLLEKDQNIPRPERFRDQEWIEKLEELVTKAEDIAEYARQHRNWRIAHLDFDTVMGTKSVPLKPLDIEEVKRIIDSIFRVIYFVHSAMYPDTDLYDTVAYQSGAGHFVAQERNRVDFVLFFDSLIQSEMESDTASDNFPDTVFKKFNVNTEGLGYHKYWKLWYILADIEKEAKHFRDTGITGPETDSP